MKSASVNHTEIRRSLLRIFYQDRDVHENLHGFIRYAGIWRVGGIYGDTGWLSSKTGPPGKYFVHGMGSAKKPIFTKIKREWHTVGAIA